MRLAVVLRETAHQAVAVCWGQGRRIATVAKRCDSISFQEWSKGQRALDSEKGEQS